MCDAEIIFLKRNASTCRFANTDGKTRTHICSIFAGYILIFNTYKREFNVIFYTCLFPPDLLFAEKLFVTL